MDLRSLEARPCQDQTLLEPEEEVKVVVGEGVVLLVLGEVFSPFQGPCDRNRMFPFYIWLARVQGQMGVSKDFSWS